MFLRLMEDYFRILEQCQDPDETFEDNSQEKAFISAWLRKLCNCFYREVEEKQMRNLYLLQLSNCITKGQLNEIFMTIPPKGKLKPLDSPYKIKIDPQLIVDQMEAAAGDLIPQNIPKNLQTHLRTKIFDNNKGACAYLAMSIGDPKDGPIWMNMGSQQSYSQDQEKRAIQDKDCSTSDEIKREDVELLEFYLQQTANELAGLAKPGESPVLEEQLDRYKQFIEDYGTRNDVCHLSETEYRTFLLLNYQTDLLYALEEYK